MRKPFFLAILFCLSSHSIARYTITPAQPLADGENLTSADGSFALGFFSPKNANSRYIGIWYNTIPVQTVVWVANRNISVTGSTGTLSVAANGTLVIVDKNSTNVAWSSGGVNVTNPVAQLLDSGNFVVRDQQSGGADSPAWQSFDHPTDTLVAGMKLGKDLKTGLDRSIVSWKSESDPAPGNYSMSIDVHGDPQVFFRQGSSTLYRTGPWTGTAWSGILNNPNPLNNSFATSFHQSFVNNTYSFYTDSSIISRVVATYNDTAQGLTWLPDIGEWKVSWIAPGDKCDEVPCGRYGMCDASHYPICNCLHGFRPKSPSDWALTDTTQGCVRITPLDCRNGTDGFWTLSGTKLPDTSNSTVDFSMTLEQCRAKCLSDCLCTAYATADDRDGGSGCIIWTSSELTDLYLYATGSNLYVRLAAADLGSSSGQAHNGSNSAIVVTVSVISVALLLACIGFVIWWRRKKQRRVTLLSEHNNDSDGENDLDLPLYDFGTIAVATDRFSVGNKLGEGGFGPVYKGMLGDEQDIAVKRLAKTSMQGIIEFKNEVTLIAKLQHRNLVRLLGCCIEGEERMLIYEYLQNKSLDFFLFDKTRSALLDWQTRYKIISGIARGLLYLHEDSRFRIIHRDLKASNILLNKEMNPKISDFGMARIFGGDETQGSTRRVVGTYGYMSPEYAMGGIFSLKSDVFSFGVLVLEIISGKRITGPYLDSSPHINLLAIAWCLWNEGKSLEFVDKSMGNSSPTDEVLKCMKVGLLCVQDRPEDRPLMSSVVQMLVSDNASLQHPKHPGFMLTGLPLKTNSSPRKHGSSPASNDITVSMLQGR